MKRTINTSCNMKKIIMAMVLMTATMAVAQTPLVPRDTIVGREVTYFYIPQWADEGSSCNAAYPDANTCPLLAAESYCEYAGEYAELLVMDTPMTIIGIAACPTVLKPGAEVTYILNHPFPVNDTDIFHSSEYLRLYLHEHDSMIMVREEVCNLIDTSRWMKYCNLIDHVNFEYPTVVGPHIFPVVERYFDTPVKVEDSCYVAITHYTGYLYVNQDNTLDVYPMTLRAASTYGDCERRPIAWRGPYFNWVFRSLRLPQYFLFAIIDTTGMNLGPHLPPCGPVENLRVGMGLDGGAVLQWDRSAEHTSWQLAVGNAESDPETYRTYTLSGCNKVLTDLDSGIVYAARVRGMCEGNGNYNYSEWSDTVQFALSRNGQPETIDGVAGKYIYLVPNPTGERVVVASSFELRHVDVYDLSGRKVADMECTGLATTLDVSDWPEGTYIVVVLNLQGTATKKLTVSR